MLFCLFCSSVIAESPHFLFKTRVSVVKTVNSTLSSAFSADWAPISFFLIASQPKNRFKNVCFPCLRFADRVQTVVKKGNSASKTELLHGAVCHAGCRLLSEPTEHHRKINMFETLGAGKF